MPRPTLKHLREVADDVATSRVKWAPFGRRSWRLAVGEDWVRGPTQTRKRCPAFPDGMPGLPYEFDTATQTIAFRAECLDRLAKDKTRTTRGHQR